MPGTTLVCEIDALHHIFVGHVMLHQVRTFGLSLMKLDIRQESTRHSEVIRAQLSRA
jgi:phosphoenolpyruvate carboxylase